LPRAGPQPRRGGRRRSRAARDRDDPARQAGRRPRQPGSQQPRPDGARGRRRPEPRRGARARPRRLGAAALPLPLAARPGGGVMFFLVGAEFLVNAARGILSLALGLLLYRSTGQVWAFAFAFSSEFAFSLVIQSVAGTTVDRFESATVLAV